MKIFEYRTSNPKIVGFLFASFAIPLLILDIVLITSYANKAMNYVNTTGIIVDAIKYIEEGNGAFYTGIIEYQDEDHKIYHLRSSVHSSFKPKIGKKVPVAYNPDDHSDSISLLDDLFLPVLVSLFVLIFGTVGFVLLRMHFKKEKNDYLLLQNGKRIEADIFKIGLDYSTSKNDRHPHLIYAKAIFGKKEIVFVSDSVWYDPEKVFPNGKIGVFIDPKDPQNYFVDSRIDVRKYKKGIICRIDSGIRYRKKTEYASSKESKPVHPGEFLRHEFIEPLGLTQIKLAKEINVPVRRINEIVLGKRNVTADTALRLSQYFKNSPQFWLYLQMDYDLSIAREKMEESIKEKNQNP